MTVSINVSDMTCDHCKMTIEKAIHDVLQVRNVIVDLDNHMVNIEGDMAVDQIVQAIKDAGYTPGDVIPVD